MGYPQKNEFKTVLAPLQLASTEERPAQLRPTALKSYQAGTLLHLAETGGPMGSWKPGVHMDQVRGSRPASHSLAESCSHAHVNRKVEDCSWVKLESQAIHA